MLTALVVLCGQALGGPPGRVVALFLACVIDLGVYGFSDKIVLSIHRAQPLTEEEAPEVFEIARDLSARAGIPAPRLYMLPSASANVFATGRSPRHASIAVTHGLVGLLNREELSGVLGHELSHILNRGTLPSSAVAALAGVLSMIASIFLGSFSWGGERDEHDKGNPLALILVAVVIPLAAALIQLVISRSREYEADRQAAWLSGNPLYLVSALRKIEASSSKFPLRDAMLATAHLFIFNPLLGKGWNRLFITHPPLEERIARLESVGRT